MIAGCGVAAQLTVGEESSYATPAASYARGLEFVSESLALQHDVLQDQNIGAGDYYPLGARRRLYRRAAAGQIQLEVAPRNFGLLFKHMLGGTPTNTNLSGTPAAYLQTHTPGPLAGHSLTIQKGVPLSDGSALRPFTAVGCKVAGWQLDFLMARPVLLGLQIDACDLRDATNPAGGQITTLATPTWASTPTVPYSLEVAGRNRTAR